MLHWFSSSVTLAGLSTRVDNVWVAGGSFVSKVERGEIRLDLIQLRRLCLAFGMAFRLWQSAPGGEKQVRSSGPIIAPPPGLLQNSEWGMTVPARFCLPGSPQVPPTRRQTTISSDLLSFAQINEQANCEDQDDATDYLNGRHQGGVARCTLVSKHRWGSQERNGPKGCPPTIPGTHGSTLG